MLKTWMYILAPLGIYVVDRIWRLFHEKGSQLSITRESAVCKGPNMVCLRIPRVFPYIAGQYCDIKVPVISNLQWHPFTIASSPHESDMHFFIKVNGDWTSRLYELFKERDGEHEDINVHIRGPYGAPAQHAGQYEHVVLIAGGVGSTPFAAITKYVHHWIMNYTSRGQQVSNSVSAAFTRNQSVQGTPSVPGTPGLIPSSGYASGQRSADPSRHMSRSESRNFTRNVSRNFSRSGSRNESRPMSRSGSGRLERLDSRGMSRSGSGRLERFNSRGIPVHALERVESGRSTPMNRNVSARTDDSVRIIIEEQRQHQPNGPTPASPVTGSPEDGISLSIPISAGIAVAGDSTNPEDEALRRFFEEAAPEEFNRPDDYDESLGNPEAPIPDRRSQQPNASPVPDNGSSTDHTMFEVIQEYDSSQALFEDEDEMEDITGSRRPPPMLRDHEFELDPYDLEDQGGLELENRILQEQTTASNALNMLGMSFGGTGLLRHLNDLEARKLRSSMVRASMNRMDDALDASLWQDRLLFYFHTVTVNWLTLWLMILRFFLVIGGSIVDSFDWNQTGLAVFSNRAFNVVDMVMAIIITIPVVGSIVMEVVLNGYEPYLSDGIANAFDIYLMVPLLLMNIVLHILNFAGVGPEVPHISKLTVVMIWPVVSWFLMWRIWRTIGSRVVLAEHMTPSHARTKSVDFIWVSPTYDQDAWLVDELLPLAKSNIVRLHRFITRHGPKTEPWMLDYEKVPLKTSYERPDWDEVFGSLVERSRSGSVIGVFFCGPHTMERMVRQAAMKAMAKSLENAIQRGYDQKRNGKDGEDVSGGRSGNRLDRVASGRGLVRNYSDRVNGGNEETRDPAQYGCSVRIAVRVENFT